MTSPTNNIGKLVRSFEKYFDVVAGEIRVKPRPALIIGFESNYKSIFNIDYELLPLSSLHNEEPDPVFDYYIDNKIYRSLGLKRPCYIRTHKISWNNVKHIDMNPPLCNLLDVDSGLFEHIIKLNAKWVKERTNENLRIVEQIKRLSR